MGPKRMDGVAQVPATSEFPRGFLPRPTTEHGKRMSSEVVCGDLQGQLGLGFDCSKPL